MTRRNLNVNIAGRVRKVTTSDILVPLYEGISNSIHAISAGDKTGRIEVTIVRAPRQGEIKLPASDAEDPITCFVISDDGIGFNEENMASFCEADSVHKATIGGKGVGRFSWLKFFDRATVESVYQFGVERRRRRFEFSTFGLDEDHPPTPVDAPCGSEVRLDPLKLSWEGKAKKSLDDIAVGIVEHFIAYFVTESMPVVTLKDGAAAIDLGQFYRTNIGKAASDATFEIKGRSFKATSLKFYLSNQTHAAFLCGDKRVADKVALGKRDPFFATRFRDSDLKSYAFQVFVQSDYLDKIVHDDRDGFRFPDPGTFDARQPDAIGRDEIVDKVLELAHKEMAGEIERMRTRNIETVKSFVASDAPQYRLVISKYVDAIANIHDTDKTKIDQSLRRLQFEEELRTRSEVGVLLKRAEETQSDKAAWTEKVSEVLSRVSDEGKATLAAYLVQRKIILQLLAKQMEIKENGLHSLEQAVHKLIFPMRTTSDDVSYEEQNLWIIDERLSYHYYLASDKPLSTIAPAATGSKKEPDVIVFNRPIALNDRPENDRLESVVIIEFKRPGESGIDGEKSPVSQIQEYIELIQAGRASTRKGRPIQVTDSMYFFGYVICDLHQNLKKILKRSSMRETPDGRGMFGFFEEHRAYIEVISYEKMLNDAQKRNRILFDKLQLS